jgi:hypothetical protein
LYYISLHINDQCLLQNIFRLSVCRIGYIWFQGEHLSLFDSKLLKASKINIPNQISCVDHDPVGGSVVFHLTVAPVSRTFLQSPIKHSLEGGLFYEAVSISHYIVLNGRIVSE